MAFKNFPVEIVGGVHPDGTFWNIGVRVKRADGLNLDHSDGVFKSNPTHPFKVLSRGSGNDQTLLRADIPMNPAQWKDGVYRLYIHDLATLNIFRMSEVEVLGADPNW